MASRRSTRKGPTRKNTGVPDVRDLEPEGIAVTGPSGSTKRKRPRSPQGSGKRDEPGEPAALMEAQVITTQCYSVKIYPLSFQRSNAAMALVAICSSFIIIVAGPSA